MESIGERFKYVRKYFNISQIDFANKIGFTQANVSRNEKGQQDISEPYIKAVVREFGVNENWLRTGHGEVFRKSSTFNLDEYARTRGASDFEIEIAKAYFGLPKEIRETVIDHFKDYLNQAKTVPAPTETRTQEPQNENDEIEAEVEAYRQELIAESKGATSLVSGDVKIRSV